MGRVAFLREAQNFDPTKIQTLAPIVIKLNGLRHCIVTVSTHTKLGEEPPNQSVPAKG